MNLLIVALGGALGALARYGLGNAVSAWLGRGFPYATLSVNLLGSLLIGLLYVWIIERGQLGEEWRLLLMVGFLGALTTFSTFSLETFVLIETGALAKAALNILTNVIVCLIFTWAGIALARAINPIS